MRVVAALLLTLSSPALAQDAISYRVTFSAATNHYLDVEATFPAGDESVEVMMAAWTPGSYVVREYARHIEGLEASTKTGEPLEVAKTRKNRWRIDAAGADTVRVRYCLYARKTTVRIDNYRVEAGEWSDRLKQYAPGDHAELLIARRDRLRRLPVELGEEPKDQWQLEIANNATAP